MHVRDAKTCAVLLVADFIFDKTPIVNLSIRLPWQSCFDNNPKYNDKFDENLTFSLLGNKEMNRCYDDIQSFQRFSEGFITQLIGHDKKPYPSLSACKRLSMF